MLTELILVWKRTQTNLVWVCRVVERARERIPLFGVLRTHMSLEAVLALAAEVTAWLLALERLFCLMHRVVVTL